MNHSRFNHEPQKIRLYGYWRSSASWRIRWALQIKNIPFEYIPVNLLKDEHKSPEHLKRNPAGSVPVLEVEFAGGEKAFFAESMAMLEWVEEVYSLRGPSLFPGLPIERAQIRNLCEIVNSMTAPLQTPKAQKKYSDDAQKRIEWNQYWISEGLGAFDKVSERFRGNWSFGNQITAADLFLVPQTYNALRFEVDVKNKWPELFRIYNAARETEFCKKAAPESQIDAAH